MLKIIVLLFLIPTSLLAKEVMSSFNYVPEGLLPEGLFTFGYSYGSTFPINGRYNDNSSYTSNKAHNTESLSFKSLVDSSKNIKEAVLAMAAFEAYDIELDSNAATVVNDIDIEANSNVYVMGYGLNNKSNLFLIVPTIKVTTKVDSKFQESNEYNRLIKELKASGQNSRAKYLEDIKRSPLRTRLDENNQKMTEEIETVSNIYLNYKRKESSFILDSTLIIPAGHEYSTDEFIDYQFNENSLSFKQGISYVYLVKSHTLSASTSYQLRTPHSLDYRIPRNENDPLSSDIEKNVRVKLGDTSDTTLQYSYKWNTFFSNYFNLRYLYSFQDSYEGSKFSKSRYEILENETESSSLSFQVGASFNTINAFLNNYFPIPVDFNIGASKVLSGKNTFMSDWIGFNLLVFYK